MCRGGNLAAGLVLSATANLPDFKPVFMLLVVPVINNYAKPGDGWHTNLHAPWLTPARMLWYRNMYFPPDLKHDRAFWLPSPNLALPTLLADCPPTWIAVSEFDLLCVEGIAFAEQLRRYGVEAEVKGYEGCTHSILGLNGEYFYSFLGCYTAVADENV